MMTGRLISDDLELPGSAVESSAPQASDSSRVLAELLSLRPDQTDSSADLVEGAISKEMLRTFLSVMSYRDANVVHHARNVAAIAVGIAQFLGWEGHWLRTLEISALLHDIGKVGIPDNVLYKPGRLTDEELDLMALHCNIAVDVLQVLNVDSAVREMIWKSNQKLTQQIDDPGQSSRETDLGGRILAVADAYDSMATTQVFRQSKTHQEILAVLTDPARPRFDLNVVAALKRWTELEGLPTQIQADYENQGTADPAVANPEYAGAVSALGGVFSQLYVLESMYDAFYFVGADRRIAAWSPGCEDVLGFTVKEMSQQLWATDCLEHSEMKADAPLNDTEIPLLVSLRTLSPSLTNVRIRHKEGHWVAVELQSMPLIDSNGQLRGVAQIIRNKEQDSRKTQTFKELEVQATHDSLTQVANRGEIEKHLKQAFSQRKGDSQPDQFSLIFMDIDHFKAVNDNHGHGAGDEVLVEFTKLLKAETYSGELIGRYGGEEFIVLCPETSLRDAVRRADRLRTAIGKHMMCEAAGLFVTASFGVAERELGDTSESLLSRADRALYMSKQGGRDCVTHLRSEDLIESEDESEQVPEIVGDDREFERSFIACIGADMVVFKLAGFITDLKAEAVQVTSDSAIIRVGSKGFLGLGNNDANRMPVEMRLFLKPLPRPLKSSSSRVEVLVKTVPQVERVSTDRFQHRARTLFLELKSFFAGE